MGIWDMVIWSYEQTKGYSNTPIRRGRRILKGGMVSSFLNPCWILTILTIHTYGNQSYAQPYGPDRMIICMPMPICHMPYIPYAHMPISSVLRDLKGGMVSSLLMTFDDFFILKPILDTYHTYHTYIWESILCVTMSV